MHSLRSLALLGALLGLGAASAAQAACEDVTEQMKSEVKRLNGPGHCDGEVGLWLTNPTATRVVCNYALERTNASWDDGQTGVKAGERRGGEGGGMWTCNGTGRIQFACAAQPDWKKDWDCKLPKY